MTRRVSVGSGGAQANGDSYEPAISADGRYVAFSSDASNLVAGDTNGATDVFVRDRVARRDPAGVGRSGRRPGQRRQLRPGDLRGRPVRGVRLGRVEPGGRRHQRRRRRVRAGPQVGQRDPAGVGRSGRRPGQQRQLRPGDLRGRPLRGVRLGGVEPGGRRHQRQPATCSCGTASGAGDPAGVGRSGRRPGQNNSYDPAISADGRYVAFSSTRRTWWPATPTHRRRVRAGPEAAGDPAGVGRSGRRPGQRPTASTRRSPRTAATWRSTRTRRTWWPATPTTPADVFVRDR